MLPVACKLLHACVPPSQCAEALQYPATDLCKRKDNDIRIQRATSYIILELRSYVHCRRFCAIDFNYQLLHKSSEDVGASL